MTDLNPTIRRAIRALDQFEVQTLEQARNLLDMWAWRHRLSPADVELILTYYPDHVVPEQYSHREDDVTGEPLPEGVEGFSLGRQDDGRHRA